MCGFNDVGNVPNLYRSIKSFSNTNNTTQRPVIKFICYSLMPNHFHFLVQQIEDGEASKFMQRLGTGYTLYFNKRHKGNGVLFHGVFKAKHVSTNAYLLHLSRYIHLNVLSLTQRDWKEKGVKDKDNSYRFLLTYKWHSLSC